jgi:hypothetical protein
MDAEYDFKNEHPYNEVRVENDPVRKWLLYKSSPYLFDADSSNGTCEATMRLYRQLWNWDTENKLSKAPSDTMNSFWITYKAAMQICCSGMSLGWTVREVDEFHSDGRGRPTKEDTCYLAENYYRLMDEDERFRELNELPYIRRFARLTHCIGNLTLVPRGFNRARSLRTKDYWDLSLGLLKDKWGVWKTGGVIPGAKDFEEYIHFYFMEMYIDAGKGDYLPLTRSHARCYSGASQLLPANREELKECVGQMNDRIEKRGEIMIRELTENLDRVPGIL